MNDHTPTFPQSTIDRFWAKVIKCGPNECWLWTGAKTKKGYGHFNAENKHHYAHVFSYTLHSGTVPANQVLHRCDVRNCVNPNHLFSGTHGDNMRDMIGKNRSPHALLTTIQVQSIRQRHIEGESPELLASEFGVRVQQIKRIIKREGWKHI